MKINSIRFKVKILHLVLLGAFLLLYSVFLYGSLYYTLYAEFDKNLRIKADEISNALDSYLDALGADPSAFEFAVRRVVMLEGQHPRQQKIWGIENEWLRMREGLVLKKDFVSVFDGNGRCIISVAPGFVPDGDFLRFKAIPEQPRHPVFTNRSRDHHRLRVISSGYVYRQDLRYTVIVATNLGLVDEILYNRLFYRALFIPLMLFLAFLLDWKFTARVLKPVMEVSRTARQITYNKDLRARVKAEHIDTEMQYLVDSFNAMLSQLEKSFKYIAEFSAHVAHELRTPLAIIKGESDLALRKEQTIEAYKRVIKTNVREADRMLNIIDDLLLLTRLDYKREIFNPGEFDFNEFWQEIYEQNKVLAGQKDIRMSLSLPAEPVMIKGEKLHLRRLFFNILHNAIKFTPPQGMISTTVAYGEHSVRVAITDTGVGISAEDLPKIFKEFFHKDLSGQGNDPGNGLGLKIAQSIVVRHQGSIEVKSIVGQGSTFIITLPLL